MRADAHAAFRVGQPLWKLIEDYIVRHTKAKLVEDAGSPLGIIASCEEEADEISAFIEPLLKNWPMLVAVRNSIYFRFSHKFYHKGACLEAIATAWACCRCRSWPWAITSTTCRCSTAATRITSPAPANAVDEVKKKVVCTKAPKCA
jgi:hypothetical protein